MYSSGVGLWELLTRQVGRADRTWIHWDLGGLAWNPDHRACDAMLACCQDRPQQTTFPLAAYVIR
jgi:hypothetical protein